MVTSFNIDQLPPELRTIIWRYALLDEARSRFVFLEQLRVFLRKYLCSPFLSVNHESRCLAQEFYSVKLNVFFDHDLSRLSNEPRAFSIAKRIETDDNTSMEGFVYVSPEFDTFLLGNVHCHVNGRGWLQLVEEFPKEACANVQNLAKADLSDSMNSYNEIQVRWEWGTNVFTGCQTHRSLCFGFKNYEMGPIIPYLIELLRESKNFELADQFQEWDWGHDPEIHGDNEKALMRGPARASREWIDMLAIAHGRWIASIA